MAVALAEVLVRWLGPDLRLLWEPHATRGWTHIAGAKRHYTLEGDAYVEINSLGHRDRERTTTPEKGVFRIAVFGDSLTEAIQVDLEDTYCARLETSLNSSGFRAFEVLNFGVSGYSPVQELITFREEVDRFSPDLIVLALFLDNDVSGCHPDLSVSSMGGPYVSSGGASPLQLDYSQAEGSLAEYRKEPLYTLRRVSALYRLVGHLRRQLTQSRAEPASKGVPKRHRIYQVGSPPPWEEAWRTFDRVLEAFVAEATDRNIPVVALSIPPAQVVDAERWKTILERHPSMKEPDYSWDLEGPERRLAALAGRLGISFCSPLAPLRTALDASRDSLYFGGLGHLTPRGHGTLAEALEECLVSGELLPAGG